MDMVVAAGGGERDIAVDGTILTNKSKAANPEAFLNERLMSDLRPTLFLAQLSNLLAGNISIVHGVTGSSRTFMGEESAGWTPVAHRAWRASGGDRVDLALVGGFAQRRARGPCCCSTMPEDIVAAAGVPAGWERKYGMVLGLAWRSPRAGGAQPRRGARTPCQLAAAVGRHVGALEPARRLRSPRRLARMWQRLAPPAQERRIAGDLGRQRRGAGTDEERAWLETSSPDRTVRATGSSRSAMGSSRISPGTLRLPRSRSVAKSCSRPSIRPGIEQAYEGPLDQVAVTAVGHWRGEGMALVEAVR
jgi:3-oxoacyl-[acyl-carrier-protein] synthase II